MNEKLLGTVTGIVVLVVILATFMMPTISEAQNGTITAFNNSTNTYRYIQDGVDNWSLTTNSSMHEYYINGEKFDFHEYGDANVVSTDVCYLKFQGHYCKITSLNTAEWNYNAMTYYQEFTYTAATNTFTAIAHESLLPDSAVMITKSWICSDIIYLTPHGNLCAIATNGDDDINYYVNDFTQICAAGVYLTGDLDTGYFIKGADGYTSAHYEISATSTINDVPGYTDLKKASGYSVTVASGESSETFTPFTVYVPATVSAHTTQDQSISDLFGIIPLMVVIAILIGAVGMIATRTRD